MRVRVPPPLAYTVGRKAEQRGVRLVTDRESTNAYNPARGESVVVVKRTTHNRQKKGTDMAVVKQMNHSEYMRKTRKMSESSLRHVMEDARQAAEAGKGWNPNVGYYLDEVHYCAMELKRRKESKHK